MALFGKDPAQKLERALAAAQGKRDNLVESLKTEEALVSELQAAADAVCDGSKSSEFLAAQAAVRAAQHNVQTFTRVLAGISEQIKKVEGEIAQIAEQRLRGETAAEIEKRTLRLEAAAAVFDAAAAELVEAGAMMGEVILDARQLESFAKTCRADIPPAVQMVVGLARSRIRATIAGNAPAALPKAPPALLPPPAPPPLQTCFTLQPAMFTDPTGMLRRVPRYVFVDLTEQQVAHALRMQGCICKPDDARVKELQKNVASQQLPEPWHCWDLNNGQPPTGDPGLLARRSSTGFGHVVFEPIDRGPPRTMAVAKGDVADKAAGARAADGIEER
jgi:hypothetical protein